ncbi:hypothetical protein SLE2022_375780 [Rubroshorea leprosula]
MENSLIHLRKMSAKCFLQWMFGSMVIVPLLIMHSLPLQAQPYGLHVQFVLRDWTRMRVESSQLFAIILSTALVFQNGQILLVLSQKSQHFFKSNF